MKPGLAGLLVVTTMVPVVAQPRPEKHMAVVRGRCVDENRQPLAGCKVTFTMPRRWHQRPDDRKPPAPRTTGKDGRFEIRFLPFPSGGRSLTISANGRFSRSARWSAFTPGQVEDLKDIWVPRGATITGRVVNRDGKPVPHVEVVVQNLPIEIGAGRWEKAPAFFQSGPDNRSFHRYGSVSARTTTRGTFRIESLVPPGEWPVRVRTKGPTMMKLVKAVVEKPGQEAHVVLEVHEGPFIEGKVVDEKGRAVAGVGLLLEGYQTCVTTTSRQDGAFRFYRPVGGAPKLVVRVADSAGCDPSKRSVSCTWGKHDVEIKLRRSLAFEMRVVDDAGKPVEEFAIKCYGSGQHFAGQRTRPRLSGRHPGGRIKVDSVPRGWIRLVVIPKDESLRIVEQRYKATDADPGPKEITLPRLAPMKVHVRDKEGNPVPFARVQVIDPGVARTRFDDSVIEDHRLQNQGVDPRSPMRPTVLYFALTNAGGHCVVYGDPGSDNLVLRVSTSKRCLYFERDVEFGKDHLTKKIQLDR